MKFNVYEYSVLKYVHDRVSGEFINVGVVLYSPDDCFIVAHCRESIDRVVRTFPGSHQEWLLSMLSHIEKQFAIVEERLKNSPESLGQEPFVSLLHKVLPKDDSSLQWSVPGSGLTQDPKLELEHLYNRFVDRYDLSSNSKCRSESDIWNAFEHQLQSYVAVEHFKPKRISVRDDDIEFKHAWKNGVWHCIAPVSFDCVDPDMLRDKAHTWLGRITSVQESSEPFKVYLIVGRPQEHSLNSDFEKAISILSKIPVDKEIYFEEESLELAVKLKDKFNRHHSYD